MGARRLFFAVAEVECVMSELAVFQLASGDIPAWAALEKRCFARPWSAAQIENDLRQGCLAALGLKQQGELLGYIGYYHIADCLEILNIAVVPHQRGQGFGAALLAAACQRARASGARHAVLEVGAANAPALRLYTRLGFVQSGRRPRYYPETGEDALLLERKLDPLETTT